MSRYHYSQRQPACMYSRTFFQPFLSGDALAHSLPPHLLLLFIHQDYNVWYFNLTHSNYFESDAVGMGRMSFEHIGCNRWWHSWRCNFCLHITHYHNPQKIPLYLELIKLSVRLRKNKLEKKDCTLIAAHYIALKHNLHTERMCIGYTLESYTTIWLILWASLRCYCHAMQMLISIVLTTPLTYAVKAPHTG